MLSGRTRWWRPPRFARPTALQNAKRWCGAERAGATPVLLAALETSPDIRLLAVQDGARPLVTPELIDRVVAAAAKCGAAAPAVPVKDTVKVAAADGAVLETPDRSTLRAVQTPQVFEAELLKAALQSALENNVPVTDDCSAWSGWERLFIW